MLVCMWMGLDASVKAASAGEKLSETIGVLRVAGGAISAEPQNAASTTNCQRHIII